MIVVVGSVRGAAGVTSWSLLLAAGWPSDLAPERVVVEADVAGGVLGVRYGLGVDPGVVSLAASLRGGAGEPVDVAVHGRRIADGVWVVPGPETAEQAASVWGHTADTFAQRLAVDERVWLFDAGRLTASGPLAAVVAHAALVVLLSWSRAEDLVSVPSRVAALASLGGRVALVMSGKSSYLPEQLAEFAGCRPVWCVDDRGDLIEMTAAVLAGGRARRSWLWRQTLEVAHDTARIAHQPDVTSSPTRLFSVRGAS